MTNKKIVWGCVLVVVGLAFGLVVYYLLVSQLPKDRPADFAMGVYEGGGMEDESLSYSIKAGHVLYEKEYESSELTAEFDFTEAELDYLWQVLRQERFDRIRVQDGGDVYDRGGTTIHVSFNDESINLSNSGSSFIEGSNAKRFYTIANTVFTLAQPYIDKQKKAVTLRISDELLSKVSYVQLNDQMIYKTGTELPAHVSLLPGEYVLAIATILPPPINSDYQRFTLTVTDAATFVISGAVDAITITPES